MRKPQSKSKAAKIRAYKRNHPGSKPINIAKLFGVDVQYVYSVLYTERVKQRKQAAEETTAVVTITPPGSQQGSITVAADAEITPEQMARVTRSMQKPRARMQSSGSGWKLLSVTTSDEPLPVQMIEPPSDPVNHPSHYKVGGIETIDFIEAKGLNYRLGNVVKYITRADHKGERLENLRKAKWYLDREIEQAVGA